jgi:hypothetical protein
MRNAGPVQLDILDLIAQIMLEFVSLLNFVDDTLQSEKKKEDIWL